jgi:DNA-binding response OmpR family regulator
MYKILVADDEIKIRETIKDYLTAKGFDVTLAKDGEVAVYTAEEESFDLILLDVLMPKKDGLTACKEIRSFTDVPILFLSALGQEENLLKGYKYGADDYIVKPFPLAVLTEKISAMIRRHKGLRDDHSIEESGIRLDLKTRQTFVGDKEIKLPLKDFNLLLLLMQNKGAVLSRDVILSKVWGWDFDGDDRTVDTHIKRIRKVLGDKARLIVTTSGVGYSFKKEE